MCVMGSCLELISSLVWIPSLQVILYHDDVEICNPLGASVKAQAWLVAASDSSEWLVNKFYM
jgi:hypothetical protein